MDKLTVARTVQPTRRGRCDSQGVQEGASQRLIRREDLIPPGLPSGFSKCLKLGVADGLVLGQGLPESPGGRVDQLGCSEAVGADLTGPG
jgi:hypothetical protein